MNDRAVGLLEQYGIEVLGTRKGRGAILCETEQGCLIFKEYTGNKDRLELQNRILKAVQSGGCVAVEQIVPTAEGALFVQDNDGVKYILKTWQDGRECSIYDKGECLEAVRLLAKLHNSMVLRQIHRGCPRCFPLRRNMTNITRSLKRLRNIYSKEARNSLLKSTC